MTLKRTTTYTIERITKKSEFTSELATFIYEEVKNINKIFGSKYDYEKCSIPGDVVLVARKNGKISGIMIGILSRSLFDVEIIILRQVLFYVKPDSGRTAYHLFHKFIDIGKSEANHIISNISSKTNIKPSSLEKLGFKQLETLYRLEC